MPLYHAGEISLEISIENAIQDLEKVRSEILMQYSERNTSGYDTIAQLISQIIALLRYDGISIEIIDPKKLNELKEKIHGFCNDSTNDLIDKGYLSDLADYLSGIMRPDHAFNAIFIEFKRSGDDLLQYIKLPLQNRELTSQDRELDKSINLVILLLEAALTMDVSNRNISKEYEDIQLFTSLISKTSSTRNVQFEWNKINKLLLDILTFDARAEVTRDLLEKFLERDFEFSEIFKEIKGIHSRMFEVEGIANNHTANKQIPKTEPDLPFKWSWSWVSEKYKQYQKKNQL